MRYIAAWLPPRDLATSYLNLEIPFSVGAGTDQFDYPAIPETVVRMVEPRIVNGMVKYT